MTEPSGRTAPESPPKLLTTSQVAKIFGVSNDAVAAWVKAGKIDFVQLPSGRYRFTQAAVDAIIAGEKAGAS